MTQSLIRHLHCLFYIHGGALAEGRSERTLIDDETREHTEEHKTVTTLRSSSDSPHLTYTSNKLKGDRYVLVFVSNVAFH
jgi:hypothetical protein